MNEKEISCAVFGGSWGREVPAESSGEETAHVKFMWNPMIGIQETFGQIQPKVFSFFEQGTEFSTRSTNRINASFTFTEV